MSFQETEPNNTYLINPKIRTNFNFDRPNFHHAINYKNKFDNRLYYSMRYKRFPNFTTEEPFTGRVNVWSPLVGFYVPNHFWIRRNVLWADYLTFGTNKYGIKKYYQIYHFLEKIRTTHLSLLFLLGANLGFLANCYYYRSLKFNLWMKTHYGENMGIFEEIGRYTLRYYIRMVRIYMHKFRLVSFYCFRKHDPWSYSSESNGMDSAFLIERILRGERFFNRRDKSFDFMRVGEVELYEYDDPFP